MTTTSHSFDHSPPPPADFDDDDSKNISGTRLCSALAYALAAVGDPDKQFELSNVVLHPDRDTGRLIVAARDGHRWHLAYVPLPKSVELRGTLSITKESAAELCDSLKLWVKHGSFCNVRTVDGSDLRWQIRHGGGDPMVLDLAPHGMGAAAEWTPPKFVKPTRDQAVVALAHDARHTAQALVVKGQRDARIDRQEVDRDGRMHMVITDGSGVELARAVIVALGYQDGISDADDGQAAIPGTIAPTNRTPGPRPTPAKKGKAKANKRASAKASPKKRGRR